MTETLEGRMSIRVGVIGAGIMGADHIARLATSIGGAEVSLSLILTRAVPPQRPPRWGPVRHQSIRADQLP